MHDRPASCGGRGQVVCLLACVRCSRAYRVRSHLLVGPSYPFCRREKRLAPAMWVGDATERFQICSEGLPGTSLMMPLLESSGNRPVGCHLRRQKACQPAPRTPPPHIEKTGDQGLGQEKDRPKNPECMYRRPSRAKCVLCITAPDRATIHCPTWHLNEMTSS